MCIGTQIAMDSRALHKLFQWLSPAYPVGAFSYSHGLEYFVTTGEIADADGLKGWLTDVLKFGSGRNDAIFLVAAFRATSDAELTEIVELATAFNPGRERQLETTAQGTAFAQATNAVWHSDLGQMPYPVAIGAAAADHGLPLTETTALYLHSFTSNLISAGVRFIPLGQTNGQRVLAELVETIDEIVADAIDASLDDLGGCAFRCDLASMKHETMTTRIFRT